MGLNLSRTNNAKYYTNINLKYAEFTYFLENVVVKNNTLITTGLINYDFLHDLMRHYFTKKIDNIYKKDFSKICIYFIYKPSFADLEPLL